MTTGQSESLGPAGRALVGGFWGLLLGFLLLALVGPLLNGVPCLGVLLLFLAPPAVGAFAAARTTPGDQTLCNSCHYDLQGSVSSRCPECGTELTILQRPRAKRHSGDAINRSS